MKPITTVGETITPDGSKFTLHEHDGDFFLRLNGIQLMSSIWTLSERLLADYACPANAPIPMRRVLIGGLGLGFSLKRVLELVGEGAEVVVAELLPEVVRWNREILPGLNGNLLEDPRVVIHEGDVYDCIRGAADGEIPKWDAILLDTDNGPTSLVQPQNHRMYGRSGFSMIFQALAPGGRVSFWAAAVEPGFERKLRRDGFSAAAHSIKAHERAKKPIHWIYVGQRPVHTGTTGVALEAPAVAEVVPVKKARKPKRRWY
ncbi:MAG: spermine synthase [Verrucomicrobiales bacterium]|jgi:spermidine synthase|nr:spermine synthase [Verrucomicrobiales bacterium]MBP9223247.1 spermine synthase [Verrucomicrobiales bacterium]HQZ30127.1 spermine synthase [Verrucomicrobiales bacterium]